MNINHITKGLLLVIGLIFGMTCLAQEPAETTSAVLPVAVEKAPDDALNRGTPRSSVLGYIKACSSFDFEKAAEYLDLRELPADVAQR
jgi:MscS family membrane protein